ncbi:MAG: hypothetical protein AABX38_02380 [Candidatus Micrarchaeota archaeon]
MKNLLFAIVFTIVLLSGCISQTYLQNFSADGTSKLSQITKTNSVEGYENFTSIVQSECQKTSNCSFTNNTLTLQTSLIPDNTYYTFSSAFEFPFNVYRAKITRLPTDKFSSFYTSIVNQLPTGIGVSNNPEALDLTKKQINSELAKSLLQSKMIFLYTVKMPGQISLAISGNYSAKIQGNTGVFDMAEVLQNSEPFILESKELNVAAILLIVVIFVLAYVSFKFFKKEKIISVKVKSYQKSFNKKK